MLQSGKSFAIFFKFHIGDNGLLKFGGDDINCLCHLVIYML